MSNPDKNGRQKVVKRSLKFRKSFNTENISVQDYIDNKGVISKRYCTVNEGELSYKAAHSFNYVNNLIQPIKFRGF